MGDRNDREESWKPNMNESESIKLLRAENKKLRQELETAENQLAEYQAAMPPIYDELESKTNEIQYLQDKLEQLNLISDETSAEVEGIKERLFKELNRLKK